jgi:hypothetical protein
VTSGTQTLSMRFTPNDLHQSCADSTCHPINGLTPYYRGALKNKNFSRAILKKTDCYGFMKLRLTRAILIFRRSPRGQFRLCSLAGPANLCIRIGNRLTESPPVKFFSNSDERIQTTNSAAINRYGAIGIKLHRNKRWQNAKY